jgi:hypothetical protein
VVVWYRFNGPGDRFVRIEPKRRQGSMTKALLLFCGVLLVTECCYALECAYQDEYEEKSGGASGTSQPLSRGA